jgi:hypothetical protein
VDQFLQAPALLAVMIMGMALMEGRGIQGLQGDMQKEYTTALMKNCKQNGTTTECFVLHCCSQALPFCLLLCSGELWIPATIVNIAFIKPDLRVLYDNLVFFFWTIFLSMLLNQPA